MKTETEEALRFIAINREIAARHSYQPVPMTVDFPDENGRFPAAPSGYEDFAWAARFERVADHYLIHDMAKFSPNGGISHFMNGSPVAPGADAIFYTPLGVRP